MDLRANEAQTGMEDWLRQPRWELIPLKGAELQLDALPCASRVTVTCSPAKGLAATLELTEQVVARGHHAIPHLSARMIESEMALRAALRRLSMLGVQEAFVVGGDRAEPLGPFSCSYDLLCRLRELQSSLKILGITGYPEGHPVISDELLLQDLLRKQPMADYVVTQLCFGSAPLVAWLEKMRAQGVWLPVFIGIPGVVDLPRLVKIAAAIGVGDSLRFLRKNIAGVARLMGGYRPDKLLQELEGESLAGLHIYTFNRVAETEAWLRAKTE